MDNILQKPDLVGSRVTIALVDEHRSYTLQAVAGTGSKGITWKAVDRFGRPYAIKFVIKEDYATHSLEAEIARTQGLTDRFAQISFYGAISSLEPNLGLNLEPLYALVVDWVDGDTFDDYCKTTAKLLDGGTFLAIARDLCEALSLLEQAGLCHNDLHAKNIMVTNAKRGPALNDESFLKIIDTGSLTTIEQKQQLLASWSTELESLRRLTDTATEVIQQRTELLQYWINWFHRTDQEWVVNHLCTLLSYLRRNEYQLHMPQRLFLSQLPALLNRMVDPNQSMRPHRPQDMYRQIELLWQACHTPPSSRLTSPFDLINAELIRSDKSLSALFSRQCPWLEQCSTADPVYIYGPRGSGKSTLLRMLSLPAVLESGEVSAWFERRPFVGVYLSCSSELRSRFWLYPRSEYGRIQGSVVKFFGYLLIEALLDTLDYLRDGVIEQYLGHSVGLTNAVARRMCRAVLLRIGAPDVDSSVQGVSWLSYASRLVSLQRYAVWQSILHGEDGGVPDPSLIFDIVHSFEDLLPILRQKQIAFLLDDFSNQRIPSELQKVLTQTISFAKQGNPIFKVTSERDQILLGHLGSLIGLGH